MKHGIRQAIAAVLVVGLTVAAAAGPLEDAELAYNKGGYAIAVKLLRPLAESGNPRAQKYLGRSYEGRGVPQDLVQAYVWLNLSVAQGYDKAIKNRDLLGSYLTPAQLAEAERLARDRTSIADSQTSITEDDVSTRINVDGFSILAPLDPHWSQKSKVRSDIPVMFSRSSPADRLHTFVLMGTEEIIDLPYDNPQKVREALQENLRAKFKPRLLKSFEILPDRHEECIGYRLLTLDEDRLSRRGGQFFNMEIHGRYCLHPYHPAYVIGISYSQRSRNGEWDNSFDGEADRFLGSLAFKPIPFQEYVAKELDAYGSTLSKLDRTTETATIKNYAKLLRSSTEWYGFNPGKVLKEYADLLRNQNDELDARRMMILVSRFQANNFAAFLAQLPWTNEPPD